MGTRIGHHEGLAGVANHPLDFPFLITFARAPIAVLEHIVRLQSPKQRAALARAIAEVGLRMTRRVRQGHERLSHRQPARMDVIPHRRVAAIESTLLAQPFVNPLDRMTRLFRASKSSARI
jgi:hypothetical protein